MLVKNWKIRWGATEETLLKAPDWVEWPIINHPDIVPKSSDSGRDARHLPGH
jgi:hypothetical protein